MTIVMMVMIEMARLNEAKLFPPRIAESMKEESPRVIIEKAITTAERSKRKEKDSECIYSQKAISRKRWIGFIVSEKWVEQVMTFAN